MEQMAKQSWEKHAFRMQAVDYETSAGNLNELWKDCDKVVVIKD